jgi:uncharacterized membrane protein
VANKTKYIIAITILTLALSFILNYNPQTEKRIIKTSFLVGDTAGFDLNPNELTFGRITPNASASRAITITNNFDKTKKISIKSSGEITKYIIASENNFLLNPNETKNITFSIYPTNPIEFKKYSGEIIIISK